MARVIFGFPLACRTERLAGARACPNRSVAPPGELEGIGPSPDTGEEVALREALDILRLNLLYRASVNHSIG
jgi:hypothetical protein